MNELSEQSLEDLCIQLANDIGDTSRINRLRIDPTHMRIPKGAHLRGYGHAHSKKIWREIIRRQNEADEASARNEQEYSHRG